MVVDKKGTNEYIQRMAGCQIEEGEGESHAGCACGRVQLRYHKVNKLAVNSTSFRWVLSSTRRGLIYVNLKFSTVRPVHHSLCAYVLLNGPLGCPI